VWWDSANEVQVERSLGVTIAAPSRASQDENGALVPFRDSQFVVDVKGSQPLNGTINF
jgi:hypothetical protein